MENKLNGLSVLVVDDEELIREVLREKFEDEGMLVDEAEDGLIAFNLITQNKYDFLVSDVRMPRCSGIELLDKVREYEGHTPKIIMMSAFSDLSDSGAKERGALGLLAKPREVENLLEVMRANL